MCFFLFLVVNICKVIKKKIFIRPRIFQNRQMIEANQQRTKLARPVAEPPFPPLRSKAAIRPAEDKRRIQND